MRFKKATQITTLCVAAALTITTVWGSNVASAETNQSTQIVISTNKERAKAGLSALRNDPKLTRAANGKASEMARQCYFSHRSPSGLTLTDLLKRVSYAWRACGENIAASTNPRMNAVKGWMNSEGHRSNILKPTYKDIGVGVATGYCNGRQKTFFVQEFGTAR